MITTILFDLDGTLLPMNQDVFMKEYFKRLGIKFLPKGYRIKKLVSAIWHGMKAMLTNDGHCTNEEVFWNCFEERFGEETPKTKEVFEDFYKNDFQKISQKCGCNPEARTTIDAVKSLGYRVVLATNPVFPAIATERRIRWAGLDKEDFEFITTYENSLYCKPKPEYYKDILQHIECKPEECLMVGNDVDDDMPAGKLGMKVFLLTDCLINRDRKDISKYPQGGFSELMEYLRKMN